MIEQTLHQSENGGIAVLRMDSPPVNALARPMRQALWDTFVQLRDSDVQAIVLTGTDKGFIAGADIAELDHAPSEPQLPALTLLMENFPKPIVVALKGFVLGGGLEVAIAAHGRVAHPTARLGFPEVNFGIIPGAGGTVRVSRLVEFADACALVQSGKPIKAIEAFHIGLVDEVCEQFEARAIAMANKMIIDGHVGTLSRDVRVSASADAWPGMLDKCDSPHMQAQCAAVQSLRYGVESPPEQALAHERATFLRLKDTAQSRALRYLFFAERKAGVEITGDATDIHTLGIVGGGTMGRGLAVAGMLAGYRVVLIDSVQQQREQAELAVGMMLDQALARGLISPQVREQLKDRLLLAQSLEALQSADLVIEAVAEDLAVKTALLPQIEQCLATDAVLCSNTSYLDLNRLKEGLKRPAQFIGMHFFAPAHINKLVEIIATDVSDGKALAMAKNAAKKMRKLPIYAQAGIGFIGNRIMSAYRQECDFLLEEGALPADVDRAMEAFGFRMGNYAVADLSGLDIAWSMRKRQGAKPQQRYSAIADKICEQGWFGRKTGRGWYDYRADDRGAHCPEVARIILAESARLGIKRRDFSAAEIMARILQAMTLEANRVLEDGVAAKPSDIDLVMVTGFGFPRTKGGPLLYQQQPGDNA